MDKLQGLAKLASLEELSLDLSSCEQLANVDCLKGVGKVKTFTIDLAFCFKLSEQLQQLFSTQAELSAAFGMKK